MPKKAKEKKVKTNELAETKDMLLRVQADFDNYRKRTQKEKEDYGKYLNTDLVLRILPVLDNFKLALAHQPKEIKGNAWAEGIWHIERQLEQILADEGVEKIPTESQKFDHNLHEAIEEVDSDKPPGEIVETVFTGYKMGDKIIRHAKVKVSKVKKGERNE
jgi:molecular chaperone GrpE